MGGSCGSACGNGSRADWMPRCAVCSGNPGVLRALCLPRACFIYALELQTVTRRELPEFPEVRRDDDERTDEPAQGWAIGSENDGHVTREVDRPDRVGVVVN